MTGGPVVVGGVGGSGTRVVAHLIRELGVSLGGVLRGDALDNSWFGFLLGERPEWYRAQPAQIQPVLSLFAKAMRGNGTLDETESALLHEAVSERFERASRRRGRNLTQSEQDVLLERERAMRKACEGPERASPWGWKTPEAHIFLEHLAVAFPTMKYIHVTRDGRDLVDKRQAKGQVRLWGSLFGIDVREGRRECPPEWVLGYCRRANQRALTLGPELLGERFLALHYESVCDDPAGSVSKVAEFLDLHSTSTLVEAFAQFIRAPAKVREPTV